VVGRRQRLQENERPNLYVNPKKYPGGYSEAAEVEEEGRYMKPGGKGKGRK
jgi:hypothetical protein